MLPLYFFPAPELLLDGEGRDGRKTMRRARHHGGIARTQVVARDDLLSGRRVEEVEIGLGALARAAPVDHRVDDGDRRCRGDAERGIDDLELVSADLRLIRMASFSKVTS